MAKHARQLRYSHEAISQAFHFLCIYSERQKAVKTTGSSHKWWTHRAIFWTAALSHRLFSFWQRKLMSESIMLCFWLLHLQKKRQMGCCPWSARVYTSNYSPWPQTHLRLQCECFYGNKKITSGQCWSRAHLNQDKDMTRMYRDRQDQDQIKWHTYDRTWNMQTIGTPQTDLKDSHSHKNYQKTKFPSFISFITILYSGNLVMSLQLWSWNKILTLCPRPRHRVRMWLSLRRDFQEKVLRPDTRPKSFSRTDASQVVSQKSLLVLGFNKKFTSQRS